MAPERCVGEGEPVKRSLAVLVTGAGVLGIAGSGVPSSSAAEHPRASAAAKKCHPNYKGRCLKRSASDYDCAGGSGNGPYYVRGPVRVVGADPFDLDRDGDGIGCD